MMNKLTRHGLFLSSAWIVSAASAQAPAEPTPPAPPLLQVQVEPAQPASCSRVVAPIVPALAWRGRASYRAQATVKDGRVVAVEIRAEKGQDVDRKTQRALIMSMETALRRYQCEADDPFEQRFGFELSERAGA